MYVVSMEKEKTQKKNINFVLFYRLECFNCALIDQRYE